MKKRLLVATLVIATIVGVATGVNFMQDQVAYTESANPARGG